MNDNCFFDTNTIIYLYSEDQKDKQQTVLDLVNSCKSNIISPQVINETVNVMRRKIKLSYNIINVVVDELTNNFIIAEFNLKTIKTAIRVADKYGFSYYDSLIIASALENNCQTLYSEDMQHDQIIENNLRIINPFR